MQELERQFKADGGTFEEYRIGEFFIPLEGRKKLSKQNLSQKGNIPVYSSDSNNNGITGYTDLTPDYIVDTMYPLYVVFGDHTRTLNIADKSFCVMDNVKVLIPKYTNIQGLLYIFAVWKKGIPNLGYARHWSVASKVNLSLPTINNEIAFSYMENVIRELQNERMSKLNDYLKESGLENTELSQEEKDTVLRLRDGCVKWQDFKIGDLFEPLKVGYIGKGKKIGSAKKNKTKEYCIPLTCAKIGDNGIMYWAKEGDFITYENALSVIADGAVSAGLVYAQPEKAGAYSHSYFIKIKNLKIPFEVNIFLSTILTKVIYPQYSRDRSPRWERICNEVIFLPVTPDGEIDWDFMQNLISAERRLAIRGVVEWKKSIDK